MSGHELQSIPAKRESFHLFCAMGPGEAVVIHSCAVAMVLSWNEMQRDSSKFTDFALKGRQVHSFNLSGRG